MLYVSDVDYDASSHVLTVRLATASRVRRVTRQYRDVSPGLAAQVAAARPHASRVLRAQVEPFHASRTGAQTGWTTPPA